MVGKNSSITQNMPQDSLRSVVIRSFVTCVDPNGVVEFGTIRKPKTRSTKMEHRSKSQKTSRNLITNSKYEDENKETVKDDSHNPSSFQLLEVSREAQKLNQTIESWSKGLTFDGQSKDIAKDILRGALDLQDSLVMFGKLQEASQYLAKLKKKQKEKLDRERDGEHRVQRFKSDRFVNQNYQMRFQKSQPSVDGSSRDSIDELRRVIRDGFAKQNLLPDSIKKEKNNSYDWKNLDSASDMPSTSSSQSSSLYSNNMARSKKKQEKWDRERVYGEGLIERIGSNKFGYKKTQSFDDGVSRVSKTDLRTVIRDSLAKQIMLGDSNNEENYNNDRKRLDSTSEAPCTSSSQSSMVCSNNLDSTASSHSSMTPEKAKVPNLIAKLMGIQEFPSPSPSQQYVPPKQLENEKMWRPIFDIGMPKARKPHFSMQRADPERRTLQEVLETMRYKGLLKSSSVKEHISSSLSKQRLNDDNDDDDDMPPIVIMKPFHFPCLDSEEAVKSNFTQKDKSLDTHTNDMPQKQNVPGIDIRKRISHTNEKHKKLEPEEKKAPIRRLSQAGNANNLKVAISKPEVKKGITNEKASHKIKPSVLVHKEEATDKRSGKARKVTPGKKMAEDKAKSKILLKFHDAMPESKSNVRKVRSPQKEPVSQTNISKFTKPIKHQNSTDGKRNQTKKRKLVKMPSASNSVMKTSSECKEDDTKINLSCDNEPVLDKHVAALAKKLSTEQETETYDTENEDNGNNCHSSTTLSEATKTNQHKSITISEEANDQNGHWEPEIPTLKTRTTLKNILLNSPSFLNHADQLFDIDIDCPETSQTSLNHEFEESNATLYFDYAKELVERKTLLTENTRVLSKRMSLQQLVEEVYEGVGDLRSYCNKLGGEDFNIDGVSSMLDRDLKCKEIVSSIWESGWKKGFSTSEVEQVVKITEMVVLGGLIEEVLVDFMV